MLFTLSCDGMFVVTRYVIGPRVFGTGVDVSLRPELNPLRAEDFAMKKRSSVEQIVSLFKQSGRGVLWCPAPRGASHRGFALDVRQSSVLHSRYNFGTFKGERKSGDLSLSGTR
jgi:hypothetical protein